MSRSSDLLYDDAVLFSKSLIDEIKWAKAHGTINNLVVFAESRLKAIAETLDAIRKLKQSEEG